MALPTAATPGYGYYYTLGPTPDVACNCLREWLTVYRRMLRFKGLGEIAVWQCTGDSDASGGTHSQGGAFDIGGISTARVMVAREMGAPATWVRNWSGNQHSHGVLSGCPHNEPARYQIAAQWAGYDGLGWRGFGGPDPHPRPSVYRTWQEGIARAEAVMSGKTTTLEEDDVAAEDVWNYTLKWSDGREATAGNVVKSAFTQAAEAKAEVAELRKIVDGLAGKTADAVLNGVVIDRPEDQPDSTLRQVLTSTWNAVAQIRDRLT